MTKMEQFFVERVLELEELEKNAIDYSRAVYCSQLRELNIRLLRNVCGYNWNGLKEIKEREALTNAVRI